ncbi:NUDIX hydrolase [Streptomyces sp. ISL-11]|uniref:NUDIX domain-containing protein n=1 Tax=Streptomyces sp. ISL-11 TaxID=2819174 RepID=UPI001BEA76F0|nr:NUDIX hydrolase [Streptomyces sp. ISL-11]MBT2383295.1 NUDIX hydrolase [Streptomyces sp. ISL-11]
MTLSASGIPPEDPDFARYLRGLPAPLVAVDALVRDESGRLLIVEPTYKPGWDIVGGFVEHEGLLTALAREAEEELGLRGLRIGRLLAVDDLTPFAGSGRPVLVFLFAARLEEPVRAGGLVLQRAEIRAAEFVPEETALARFPEPLRLRVLAALEAERGAHTAYLRDGQPLPASGRDYYATLPSPMVAATALITDEQGQVLVLEHTYQHSDGSPYGLPGGMVLAHESAAQGAAREIDEELGLGEVPVGRLLAVDSAGTNIHGRALEVQVFAVGPLSPQQVEGMRFTDGEVRAVHWLMPEEALVRLPERAGLRVMAGLRALAAGGVAHLDHGVAQIGSPVGIPAARRAELEARPGGVAPRDHIAMRPKNVATAMVLFTDRRGRVLIVKPVHRSAARWIMPGGGVDSDAGESPRQAAAREVREELGLDCAIGPLLAIDWSSAHPAPAEVVYAYDGGVLEEADIAAIRLPPHEWEQCQFMAAEELPGVLLERLLPRVQTCLAIREAHAGGVELINGRPLAEGAVAIIHRRVDGALLLHERDEHAPDWPEYWSLLGCGAEPGELSYEALRRELWEEARLPVPGEAEFVERVWDRDGSQQLISIFAIPYDGRVEDLRIGEGRQLRFVDPADLDGYRTPPYLRAALDRWLTGRRSPHSPA